MIWSIVVISLIVLMNSISLSRLHTKVDLLSQMNRK